MVRKHERGLATHGQTNVGVCQDLVNRLAHFIDVRPDFFGVRLGATRGFRHTRHFHEKRKGLTQVVVVTMLVPAERSSDGRGRTRIGRTG